MNNKLSKTYKWCEIIKKYKYYTNIDTNSANTCTNLYIIEARKLKEHFGLIWSMESNYFGKYRRFVKRS